MEARTLSEPLIPSKVTSAPSALGLHWALARAGAGTVAVGRDTGSGSSRPHYERRRVLQRRRRPCDPLEQRRRGARHARHARPPPALQTWKPPSSLEQVTAPPTTTPAFTALPPNQSQPMLVTSNLDPATHHRRRLARASLTTRHLLPFVLGARHSPSNVLRYLGQSPRPTNIRPGSAQLLSANKSRSILRGPRCDSFGSYMTLAFTGLRLVRLSALSAESHLIHSLTQIVALKYGTMGSHLIPLSPSAVTFHLIHAH